MADDQHPQRSSGILLHLTSLPSAWGIGDLGENAYRFVDWLASADQSYWQMLPVGPTGYGDSPYALLSLFGGNPLLISLDALISEGLLPATERPGIARQAATGRVDYGQVIPTKLAALRRASDAFRHDASHDARTRFEEFVATQASWLVDYCRFMALKDENGGRAWHDWKNGEPDQNRVDFHQVVQYWFHRQWGELRAHAREKSIQLIGDVPIYPAYDSADVWAHPENYQMDQFGRPSAVAGVPPDYFSPTGQLWGNPLYDWDALRRDGFKLWVNRLRYLGSLFDVLRLDHFRGFAGYWRVPAGEATAENGQWMAAPGRELFETLIHDRVIESPENPAGVRLVAEDLGLITEDVNELRERFGFPGMRVLQFGFDGAPDNLHLPHNYARNLVAYTTTHDNDTIRGWYASQHPPAQDLIQWYVGASPNQWSFIRQVAGSVATIAIYPLQDVLGLGSGARMNFPGRGADNWTWRFSWAQLTEDVRGQLELTTQRYARGRPDPHGS